MDHPVTSYVYVDYNDESYVYETNDYASGEEMYWLTVLDSAYTWSDETTSLWDKLVLEEGARLVEEDGYTYIKNSSGDYLSSRDWSDTTEKIEAYTETTQDQKYIEWLS